MKNSRVITSTKNYQTDFIFVNKTSVRFAKGCRDSDRRNGKQIQERIDLYQASRQLESQEATLMCVTIHVELVEEDRVHAETESRGRNRKRYSDRQENFFERESSLLHLFFRTCFRTQITSDGSFRIENLTQRICRQFIDKPRKTSTFFFLSIWLFSFVVSRVNVKCRREVSTSAKRCVSSH